MVRTRNLEQFHRYVIDLWKYLKQIYKDDPKTKTILNKAFQRHRSMDKVQYMEYILRNLSPYIKYITQRDEFIFTPEFGNKPLKFLIGLDFKDIWKPILTSEQKKVIFRYLEFLYMQSSRAFDKNEDKVKEIKEAILMEQEIEKEAAENPDMFADQDGGGAAPPQRPVGAGVVPGRVSGCGDAAAGDDVRPDELLPAAVGRVRGVRDEGRVGVCVLAAVGAEHGVPGHDGGVREGEADRDVHGCGADGAAAACAEADQLLPHLGSGDVVEDVIWGRGALDMKGMGVMELYPGTGCVTRCSGYSHLLHESASAPEHKTQLLRNA